jgi:MerR family transcriptional regulator/heat shock protein HspR
MTARDLSTYIDITVAARLARVSPRAVHRYIQLGLIGNPLTADELTELRRVRRLTSLGVNLAGVEIILRMRRRIVQLQAEIDRLEALLDAESRGALR